MAGMPFFFVKGTKTLVPKLKLNGKVGFIRAFWGPCGILIEALSLKDIAADHRLEGSIGFAVSTVRLSVYVGF
ncbi:MAG: hypothetical protein ACYCO5_01365 [Acidobacteriaceae bacterium]